MDSAGHILDNPVWASLTTHMAVFNTGNDRLRFFSPEVSPFAGMASWNMEDLALLNTFLPEDRAFSVMKKGAVGFTPPFEVVFACLLYQMTCEVAIPAGNPFPEIRPLGTGDIPDMLALTRLTRPGPFFAETLFMGRYFGIFAEGRLAAMAGERLQLPGYTEISAICTHPDFTGRGYGKKLTSFLAALLLSEGKLPFLHVKTDNAPALRVYHQCGFRIRTEIDFAIFKKHAS